MAWKKEQLKTQGLFMGFISEEYKELQRELHERHKDYGVSAGKHVDKVVQIIYNQGISSVLDYGCGKGEMEKGLRKAFTEDELSICSYDPCVEGKDIIVPSDLVLCLDVMEHVEQKYVLAVLDQICAYTKKVALFNISLREAKKVLADGRNAHITLLPARYWIAEINTRFDISSLLVSKSAVTLIANSIL